MSTSRGNWRGWLFRAAVLVTFAGGLSLLGAAVTAYGDQKCFSVPFLNHCGQARWAMVIGAVLAVGSTAALWRHVARRGRT